VTEETSTSTSTSVVDRPPPLLPVAVEPAVEPDPLSRRFLNVRTVLSFGVGLAILVFVLSRVDVNLGEIRARLSQTQLPLFLAAVVLYYLTFPVRALRWQQLLKNVGYENGEDQPFRMPSSFGLAEIVLLSWFANCVVPAKLGDAYRAYLLKSTAGVSFSKTFGTILAERIIDMLLLFALLALSVLVAFSGALPAVVLSIMQVGLLLVLAVVAGLFVMRNLGGLISGFVP
jgi:uncharacterized protein (TIRG00374 family)